MAKNLDLTLSSFVFESDHPLFFRDRIGAPDERSDTYDDRYDFHTLIYDCYLDEVQNEVVVVCPSLLNFRRLVEEARFAIDGVPAPLLGISGLKRGSLLRFAAPEGGAERLSFEHPRFSGSVAINRCHLDVFAGKNVLYAISKNNKLEWIRDWLTYYVTEHGANAVVLYDNQSTDYTMEALGETMASVPGIEATAIVRAWFPFGPGGAGNTNFQSKFLHMTMVELGRRRLLGQARAVLNVDIDELVYARSGQSIFDATVESPEGYVRFNGRWAYAKPPGEGESVRHFDHQFLRLGREEKVNRKYCVAPLGPLQGYPWLTHCVKKRSDPTNENFGFWHFRRVSNNWDYNREDFDAEALAVDPRLSHTMQRVFDAPAVAEADPADVFVPAPAAPKRLIITAMKNEAPYILEWIAYHRLLGFDHFLVYTNDCSDGTDLILDRLSDLGLVTHVRNTVLKRGPQKSALKFAKSHPVAQQAEWILVADIDEFLNIRVGQGRLDDLLAAVPEADAIPVTWRLFSNNGRLDYSSGLVMEDYTDAELPVENGGQPRRFVKTLFRPRPEVSRFGTHGPIHAVEDFAKIRWQRPDGGAVEPETSTRPEGGFAYPVAQFNHYATRSIDSYLVKRDRGRVNHFREVMGLEYWEKMNQGGQLDTSILRWRDATRAEMARMLGDAPLSYLVRMAGEWHQMRIKELRALPEYEEMRNALIALPSSAVRL